MHYHVYVLDYRLHITETYDCEARNDLAALSKAIALSSVNPVEVWQESRLVARIGMDGEVP